VRELLGIDFLKMLNCSYRALRLPVWPIVEAQKGSGEAEGLLSREGAHFYRIPAETPIDLEF
jgi:hypothetical protein